MELKISETLKKLPTIDYRSLNELQGNLKSLSDQNFERLKNNLFGTDTMPANGFVMPFYVWFNKKEGNKPYIVDGHQRLIVLQAVQAQPYELPYVEIEAKDKKQAKERLLLMNSTYGKIERDGVTNFLSDVGIAEDWLKSFTTFGDFTMPVFEDTPASAEIDLDAFFEPIDGSLPPKDISFKIVLEYNEDDYREVIEAFKKHTGSKEEIVAKLLGV